MYIYRVVTVMYQSSTSNVYTSWFFYPGWRWGCFATCGQNALMGRTVVRSKERWQGEKRGNQLAFFSIPGEQVCGPLWLRSNKMQYAELSRARNTSRCIMIPNRAKSKSAKNRAKYWVYLIFQRNLQLIKLKVRISFCN